MAFIRSGWRGIGGFNREFSGGQVFSYVNTDDSVSEMKESGYFDEISTAVQTKDIVWLIGSNGIGYISVNNPGVPVTVSTGQPLDAEVGIIAFAGGGQANATPLRTVANFIDTVATTNDSVLMPPGTIAQMIHIYNRTANTANIFPQSGETINGGAANAAVTVTGVRVLTSDGFGNWESH